MAADHHDPTLWARALEQLRHLDATTAALGLLTAATGVFAWVYRRGYTRGNTDRTVSHHTAELAQVNASVELLHNRISASHRELTERIDAVRDETLRRIDDGFRQVHDRIEGRASTHHARGGD